jgi:hypothetical protein
VDVARADRWGPWACSIDGRVFVRHLVPHCALRPKALLLAYAYAAQMWTRNRPFPTLRESAILLRVTQGQRPERPTLEDCRGEELPEEVWTLITACWAQDAGARPRMVDVVRRLRMLPGADRSAYSLSSLDGSDDGSHKPLTTSSYNTFSEPTTTPSPLSSFSGASALPPSEDASPAPVDQWWQPQLRGELPRHFELAQPVARPATVHVPSWARPPPVSPPASGLARDAEFGMPAATGRLARPSVVTNVWGTKATPSPRPRPSDLEPEDSVRYPSPATLWEWDRIPTPSPSPDLDPGLEDLLQT